MTRNLAWTALILIATCATAAAEQAAGMVLYFQSGGETYLLLAEHRGSKRGWAGFGGGAREGETVPQNAAHKGYEETRGAFNQADLMKKIEGQEPVMDGTFASYFAQVDFVPAAHVRNYPPPDTTDAFLERGAFAWIPYSLVKPLVEKDIDRKKKYIIDPTYLPAGSETNWFWPIWLGNMRKAVLKDALPWQKK